MRRGDEGTNIIKDNDEDNDEENAGANHQA